WFAGFGLLLGLALLASLERFPGFLWTYPLSLLLIGICMPFGVRVLAFGKAGNISNPRKRKRTKLGFTLRLRDGWINITNPFRGILVIGGAGSGKSYSVAEPIIEQAVKASYSGIVYDFKFPTLTEVVYQNFCVQNPAVDLRVINFSDLGRSYRVNPLKPENLPLMAYAEEFALSLITNLMPETIQHKDFWMRSANAILTATIWYMKKHHPAYSTLPHIVALICSKDYEKLIALLERDKETAGMIASLSVAIANEAERQVSGMMGSLQIALARLNNPEIFWVLSGDDFDLNLNQSEQPTFLCIGNNPSLSDSLAPVVSLIITVALKLMNQQGKHHSMILLDEGPSLYIPNFDQIPATARSNRIATVYMAQDISQMEKHYGKVNAEVILSNLNNQLFGRVSNPKTAEYVSKIFGKAERLVVEKTESSRLGRNLNTRVKEREILKAQEVMNLDVGEFAGMSVGKPNESFCGRVVRRGKIGGRKIPAFASGIDTAINYERIHIEAEQLLNTPIIQPTNSTL
ncbi:MAG: type IV secretory system conjugative DNA transfer family protein, partial [Bacteroidota bacterium]